MTLTSKGAQPLTLLAGRGIAGVEAPSSVAVRASSLGEGAREITLPAERSVRIRIRTQ